MTRRAVLLSAAGATGGAAAIAGATGVFSTHARPAASRGQVTLYKNPQCDCCESYASYLGDHGFAVRVIPSNDLTMMGENYGIPAGQDPCHISLVADYVVGGHIPVGVIDRMLTEKPRIVGINLPGMPTGMPGMPGPKPGPVQIYEIVKGRSPKVYATV